MLFIYLWQEQHISVKKEKVDIDIETLLCNLDKEEKSSVVYYGGYKHCLSFGEWTGPSSSGLRASAIIDPVPTICPKLERKVKAGKVDYKKMEEGNVDIEWDESSQTDSKRKTATKPKNEREPDQNDIRQYFIRGDRSKDKEVKF